LQLSTRDPRIATTVLGFSKPSRVDENICFYERSIPEELWNELAALTPAGEFWLDAARVYEGEKG
jgi:D-threo-aldose 1-dehydrogenase